MLNFLINQLVILKHIKIACVTSIFKSGDGYLVTNYRPISVLAYFSKMLERIMCNSLRILTENKFLYEKRFAF